MPPASARTRSPASGSSPAPARSRSTPASVEVYFARPVLRMMIQQPLVAAARAGQYDVICTVSGGGLSGQAGAVRHGISKALTVFEPELRGVLKKGGFLTRDTRVVERKKYGKAKARRSLPVLEALIVSLKFAALAAFKRRKGASHDALFYCRVSAQLIQFFMKTCL